MHPGRLRSQTASGLRIYEFPHHLGIDLYTIVSQKMPYYHLPRSARTSTSEDNSWVNLSSEKWQY